MRQGRVAGSINPAELRTRSHPELRAEIVRVMFGEEARTVAGVAELREELVEAGPRRHVDDDAEVVLELRGLTVPGEGFESGIEDVSFQLHEGEILGIAGMDGSAAESQKRSPAATGQPRTRVSTARR
jgi:ABC-type uncharacterized transport system ATPase subunit